LIYRIKKHSVFIPKKDIINLPFKVVYTFNVCSSAVLYVGAALAAIGFVIAAKAAPTKTAYSSLMRKTLNIEFIVKDAAALQGCAFGARWHDTAFS